MIAVLVFFAGVLPVHAQGLSIIRDTQIERILDEWAEPVLNAAGLDNGQVRIALVNSSDVNAFVAGGANIFIYAGLIQKADYPEEVIGVIAHEIGHITGGHLIASRDAMDRASFQSILANVLGIGAAILTGNGGAAGAIVAGGQGLAARGFLGHSRTQESAADHAGFKYMEGASINPEGMVSFLEKLEGQELLPASQQSEYMRTHPLTRDRLDTARIIANKSSSRNDLGQSKRQNDFDMMKAKLLAFREPNLVPRYYDINTGSAVAMSAHAIMHYRQRNFDTAIDILDDMTAKNPRLPFVHELKGQTLRDAGRLAKSEKSYRTALNLISGEAPLIQVALAHVLVEQQKNALEAENLLIQSLNTDRKETRAYRLLATLKGRAGDQSSAQYYLAEEAISQGRKPEARRLLALAMQNNDLDASIMVKARDLKTYLDGLPETSK
jgi:predicted Zn-dependent protease